MSPRVSSPSSARRGPGSQSRSSNSSPPATCPPGGRRGIPCRPRPTPEASDRHSAHRSSAATSPAGERRSATARRSARRPCHRRRRHVARDCSQRPPHERLGDGLAQQPELHPRSAGETTPAAPAAAARAPPCPPPGPTTRRASGAPPRLRNPNRSSIAMESSMRSRLSRPSDSSVSDGWLLFGPQRPLELFLDHLRHVRRGSADCHVGRTHLAVRIEGRILEGARTQAGNDTARRPADSGPGALYHFSKSGLICSRVRSGNAAGSNRSIVISTWRRGVKKSRLPSRSPKPLNRFATSAGFRPVRAKLNMLPHRPRVLTATTFASGTAARISAKLLAAPSDSALRRCTRPDGQRMKFSPRRRPATTA